MKIFPTKEIEFKLNDNRENTIDRLNRRTEKSKYLTSAYTDKSFRGIINGNHFRIISSEIGKGAFCVMAGTIALDKVMVEVEINKAFKILLSILLLFPIIGVFITSFTTAFSLNLIPTSIAQMLIIRYIFVELAFLYLSKKSLNRLRDVLDLKWIKN